MAEHAPIYLWTIGIISTVICTAVPLLFYVLGLRIKNDILEESKSLRKEVTDVRLEIVRKMSETNTCNQVMGEKLKTLEVRVGHMERDITRTGDRVNRMSVQLTRLLAHVFPDIVRPEDRLVQDLGLPEPQEESGG